MNPQPKPSEACPPGHDVDVRDRPERPQRRVPAIGPRLLFTWPVEFEVEPWRP